MQISTSSLLTAQQARPQTPVQPRAPQKADETEGFEPLLFAAKAPAQSPAPEPVAKPAAAPMPFARPGSQLDIKI